MNDRLITALKQLDPANPNHWTVEGLPRLETVCILVGDQSVTRAKIVEVAPAFTRSNQLIGSIQTEPGVKPGDVGISGVVHVDESLPAEVGATDEELVAILEEELAEAYRQRDMLNKAIHEHETRRDQLQMRIEANAPKNKLSAQVQGYHERQLELRQSRVAARKILQDSGVNLRELAKMTQGAPIDTARQRR